MREKKVMRLVLSFSTTTHAMAAEKWFQEEGLPGRLIPLPPVFLCGMWVGVVYRYRTESLCGKGGKEGQLQIQEVHEVELYERKER